MFVLVVAVIPCTACIEVGQWNARKNEERTIVRPAQARRLTWFQGVDYISGSKRCLGQKVLPNNRLHFALLSPTSVFDINIITYGPPITARMNPPESKDNQNLWSFNHRTRVHYTFDSESDPDSEAETNSIVDLPSDDTRLIQELDISSRHETVEYKPNPWSIARINAVSRPPNKELPSQAISEDVRQKSQPRGRIVDAFKVQAERKLPRAPPILKALKFTKPKSTTSQVSLEHQVCSQIQGISNSGLGDYSQHNNASFLGRGPQSRFSDMPAISSSNPPQGDLHDLRVQPHPDVPTQTCTPDSKHDSIKMGRKTLLQRSAAHISTPDMNLMLQSRYNAPFVSMSSPLTSCDYPVKASHLRPGGYQSSPPRPFINTSPRLLACNQSSLHFRHGVRLTGSREYLDALV
jgi:hypothetical protein